MKFIKYDLQLFWVSKFSIVEVSQLHEDGRQEAREDVEPTTDVIRVEVLSRFDTQLERIAATLNAFESQLQNVDRQIKDLETLASNLPANTTVSLEKKSIDEVTGQVDIAADSEPAVEKKKLIERFNEKISGIQNFKDFIMTTAKNIYFASIPLLMLLTAAMPTETKNFLTKLENLKGNVTTVITSDSSYSDKLKALPEAAENSFLSPDEIAHAERNSLKKTTDSKAEGKKQDTKKGKSVKNKDASSRASAVEEKDVKANKTEQQVPKVSLQKPVEHQDHQEETK